MRTVIEREGLRMSSPEIWNTDLQSNNRAEVSPSVRKTVWAATLTGAGKTLTAYSDQCRNSAARHSAGEILSWRNFTLRKIMKKTSRIFLLLMMVSIAGLTKVSAQISDAQRNSAEQLNLSEILPMPYPADNSGSVTYSMKPNETKTIRLIMRVGMTYLQVYFPSSLERTEKTIDWELYTDGGNSVDQGTDGSKIETVNVYRHKTPAGKVVDLTTKSQPSTYFILLKCNSSKPCENTLVIRESKNKLEMPVYTENMLGDGP